MGALVRVQDAINVAAHGIGPPVQMIEKPLGEDGQCKDAHKLADDEIRILEEKILEWKEAESEVLTRFVGLKPTPASETGTTATGTTAS